MRLSFYFFSINELQSAWSLTLNWKGEHQGLLAVPTCPGCVMDCSARQRLHKAWTKLDMILDPHVVIVLSCHVRWFRACAVSLYWVLWDIDAFICNLHPQPHPNLWHSCTGKNDVESINLPCSQILQFSNLSISPCVRILHTIFQPQF